MVCGRVTAAVVMASVVVRGSWVAGCAGLRWRWEWEWEWEWEETVVWALLGQGEVIREVEWEREWEVGVGERV